MLDIIGLRIGMSRPRKWYTIIETAVQNGSSNRDINTLKSRQCSTKWFAKTLARILYSFSNSTWSEFLWKLDGQPVSRARNIICYASNIPSFLAVISNDAGRYLELNFLWMTLQNVGLGKQFFKPGETEVLPCRIKFCKKIFYPKC